MMGTGVSGTLGFNPGLLRRVERAYLNAEKKIPQTTS